MELVVYRWFAFQAAESKDLSTVAVRRGHLINFQFWSAYCGKVLDSC